MQNPSTSSIDLRARTGWQRRRTLDPGATASEDASV
jgi:hypothetical protein